ncbi:enoyl-CoA hydratase/isomerase family protein [Pseudarthrobacter defluvii]|uniref:enoyl-CoA hydratase/isomerase family protein n=1 Tax=Pseudarthrobacter defluvii TaxID=410837 RepID=UPI0027D79B6A|nr:enoyl-CoA hydratase/isomerase family protein [Pseudarthrobacter defluvii]
MATVSFGGGERLNALGLNDWQELRHAIHGLAADPSLRAVVVRGRGGVFCSGFDVREWDGAADEEVNRTFDVIEAALQALEDLPVPTLAVVEGVAAGAGCQLALACDLQLLTPSARIGMPVARLGLLVPATFATRLALRVGPSRSKDLLYAGRMLTARQAWDMGLVTTLAPDDNADAALAAVLDPWKEVSAASLRASKAAVDEGLRQLTEAGRWATRGPAVDPHEFRVRVTGFLHRHRGTPGRHSTGADPEHGPRPD